MPICTRGTFCSSAAPPASARAAPPPASPRNAARSRWSSTTWSPRCRPPRRRVADRLAADGHRAAHADRELLAAPPGAGNLLDDFTPLSLPGVPRLCVDTTRGYDPPLADIVAFVQH
ncbi:hypothetical protein ACWC9T_27470 [Kitasatospora sp. NPDC001159]